MNHDTALRLFRDTGEEIEFPRASALFLDVALEQISGDADLVRTVNGDLIDISDPSWRKYGVSVSCSDKNLPPLAGLWRGQRFTLHYPTPIGEEGSTPSRPAVPGSVEQKSGWVRYRPILDVRLVSAPSISETEDASRASWSLDFEEV